MGGTYVLSSFVQTKPFYTGQNVAVLIPLNEMSVVEKLYYCYCISKNRYKYSAFGREANKTLGSLLVPAREEIAKEFLEMEIMDFSSLSDAITTGNIGINTSDWKEFRYDEIFEVVGGYYNKKPEHLTVGSIPFIGATRENNGITEMYSIDDISLYHKDGSTKYDDFNKKYFRGNCITVVNNGASTGYAFYREEAFTASHDVNILYLRNRELNPYIAMFLISIIEKEKYRWSYGRKWRPKRMVNSLIKLPIKKDDMGKVIKDRNKKHIPDWDYMEKYIECLSYSNVLQDIKTEK